MEHGRMKPGVGCKCGFVSVGVSRSHAKSLLNNHFIKVARDARRRPASSGFGVGRDIEIQDIPLHKMGLR